MKHIKARIMAWGWFFDGKLTFFQTLGMMFPQIWRPKSLRGHIFQIITQNQYHVELIKPNAAVVDAGANIGVFSVFAAQKHPDCTIYAFEPTPKTFDVLRENTKNYLNIKCFNCVLGDFNGTASLVRVPRSDRAASIECRGLEDGNYIGHGGTPVPMKTIDSLDIPMDFLKMDVEGSEANVLKGAAETIKKNKPIIAMSAYHRNTDKVELPLVLNSIAPYHCELRHDAEEDFICKPI